MLVLVDNGHGVNTSGKCSPDGKFREYKWNREIAHEVVAQLRERGYCAELLVKEDIDISLADRVKRANNKCNQLGVKNVILVSIHVNAAGNGKWMSAKGWSCFTSKGLTKSDKIADELYKVAEEMMPTRTMRKEYSDGDADWEAGFYILKNTKCPAVLTENFFMDNRDDLDYLTSAEGRKAIVATHVEGIINYVKEYGK